MRASNRSKEVCKKGSLIQLGIAERPFFHWSGVFVRSDSEKTRETALVTVFEIFPVRVSVLMTELMEEPRNEYGSPLSLLNAGAASAPAWKIGSFTHLRSIDIAPFFLLQGVFGPFLVSKAITFAPLMQPAQSRSAMITRSIGWVISSVNGRARSLIMLRHSFQVSSSRFPLQSAARQLASSGTSRAWTSSARFCRSSRDCGRNE